MDRKKMSWGRRIYHWTLTHGSHVRSIWLLAVASIGDYFIPALPTQSSVILLSLMQAQRSRQIVFAFVLAAATGAGILITLANLFDSFLAANLITTPRAWLGIKLDIQELILTWGAILLLLLSCLPTPPRLAVITACSLGLPWYEIVGAVAAGKAMWLSLIVWLIRKMPKQLQRIPLLGKTIMQFKLKLAKEQS